MPDKVAKDVVVGFEYKLYDDEDGSFIEESDVDEPLEYLHGHDNIIPGLESQLDGHASNEEMTVVVEPAEAYGELDEEAVAEVELDKLPDDLKPEIGMILQVTDDDGDMRMAHVTELTDEIMVLDLNHPMAGKRLRFEIKITGLRDATPDELSHGHVHGEHSHH